MEDARRLLKKVAKQLKATGYVAQITEPYLQDETTIVISIVTNAGDVAREFIYEQHCMKRMHVAKTWYSEGSYDWQAEVYIKPEILAILKDEHK